MAERTKLVTPPFRVSFPQVFEPKGMDGSEPKFSVVAVFDPSQFDAMQAKAFEALKAAAEAAAVDKFKKPLSSAGLRNPFRDGAEKAHLEGFGEGLVFMTLSSKMRPGIIDRNMQDILDPSDFYPGCYARATVSCYAYDNVSKGVGFGLQNLQKLGDGDNLTGRTNAADDFGDDAPEWGSQPATSDVSDDDLLG